MLAAQQGIGFMAEMVLKADNQDDICRNIATVRQIFINFVLVKVPRTPHLNRKSMAGENKIPEMAKIIFLLERDEDGYPPFSEESLWGQKCEGGYIIDNVPFFVYDISLEDVVSVKKQKGKLFFHQHLHKSTNSTIRIFCKNHSLMEKTRQRLVDLGCYWEYSNTKSYSSVNIPLDVAEEVIAFLDSEEELSYEISSQRF